jgi:hypothetical protein
MLPIPPKKEPISCAKEAPVEPVEPVEETEEEPLDNAE